MEGHHTNELLEALTTLHVTRDTTEGDAMAAIRPIAMLDQSMVGVTRFVGLTPWERHPGGDELLYIIAGSVEVTIRSEDGSDTRFPLGVGGVCVVPRGLWHRQHAPDGVALLFATPIEGSINSWDDDPTST